MPRRPSPDARWIICYGCDRSELGDGFEVVVGTTAPGSSSGGSRMTRSIAPRARRHESLRARRRVAGRSGACAAGARGGSSHASPGSRTCSAWHRSASRSRWCSSSGIPFSLVTIVLTGLVLAACRARRADARLGRPRPVLGPARGESGSRARLSARARDRLPGSALPRRPALGPVRIRRVVVLGPEGEGDLLLRRPRRAVLQRAAERDVSAARAGARGLGLPLHGLGGRRHPPRAVLVPPGGLRRGGRGAAGDPRSAGAAVVVPAPRARQPARRRPERSSRRRTSRSTTSSRSPRCSSRSG